MRSIRIAISISMLCGLLLISGPTVATHGEKPCTPVAPYSITGTASNYPTTAGFAGQPVVALPLAMGGCYTGRIHGEVEVCGSTCARLPVADYCQCYWGSSDQRIIDLSYPAWELVTDQPRSVGLITVTVTYGGAVTAPLPNTALRWGLFLVACGLLLLFAAVVYLAAMVNYAKADHHREGDET